MAFCQPPTAKLFALRELETPVLCMSCRVGVNFSRSRRCAYSGLFSFASTTLILSLFNLQTRHIGAPNVVVGMAIFCGGLAQLLAGMWEFPRGNVFGATGEFSLNSLAP